jgi:predicted esterase
MNPFFVHKNLIWILLFMAFCPFQGIAQSSDQQFLRLDTLFDVVRQRLIPIAIYSPKVFKTKRPRLVIFNHGYGQNKGGDCLAYTYLTEKLASEGYVVVSIQHELMTDSLLLLTGIPQVVRRPFWDRGADNIMFVINALKKSDPTLDFKHITLIGHSNGGDMAALFPQKYPNIVHQIITLDNRRMALPMSKRLKVSSLRSNDQVADDNVLPNVADAKKYHIQIVKLQNTKHNDMDDNANPEQQKEINDYILKWLQ